MTERTLQILQDLEAVREDLLALSDDIRLSIDHTDDEAFVKVVEKFSCDCSLSTQASNLTMANWSVEGAFCELPTSNAFRDIQTGAYS